MTCRPHERCRVRTCNTCLLATCNALLTEHLYHPISDPTCTSSASTLFAASGCRWCRSSRVHIGAKLVHLLGAYVLPPPAIYMTISLQLRTICAPDSFRNVTRVRRPPDCTLLY